MKKFLGLSSLLLLLFLFFSCKTEKNNIDFDTYDDVFAENFYTVKKFEKEITKLEAFYYNTWYYYDVTYNHKDKNDINVLYILRYNGVNTFFNIENEEFCMENVPSKYQAYLIAKNDGDVKKYSAEEILKLEEKYLLV